MIAITTQLSNKALGAFFGQWISESECSWSQNEFIILLPLTPLGLPLQPLHNKPLFVLEAAAETFLRLRGSKFTNKLLNWYTLKRDFDARMSEYFPIITVKISNYPKTPVNNCNIPPTVAGSLDEDEPRRPGGRPGGKDVFLFLPFRFSVAAVLYLYAWNDRWYMKGCWFVAEQICTTWMSINDLIGIRK